MSSRAIISQVVTLGKCTDMSKAESIGRCSEQNVARSYSAKLSTKRMLTKSEQVEIEDLTRWAGLADKTERGSEDNLE